MYNSNTYIGLGLHLLVLLYRYSTLDFPSITLCNINPLRYSRKDNFSEELHTFLDDVVPQTDYTYLPYGPVGHQANPPSWWSPGSGQARGSGSGYPESNASGQGEDPSLKPTGSGNKLPGGVSSSECHVIIL